LTNPCFFHPLRLPAYFVGGGLQLRAPELVYTGADRPRLQTEAMGTVVLDLGVITHNFENYGVET
jgi:B9 domain-containing protein 2